MSGRDYQQNIRELSGIRELTILYVEDAERREMLAQALPTRRVVQARNGLEALQALHYQVFDAYVLHQWLRDMTGNQLCRMIRRNDAHAPILFYPAAQDDVCRRRALGAGASECLQIPFEASVLQERLEHALVVADVASLAAKQYADEALEAEAERCALKLLKLSRSECVSRTTIEHATRANVYQVFVAHRGTRANFERWWPQMFASAIASNTVLRRATRGAPAASSDAEFQQLYASP